MEAVEDTAREKSWWILHSEFEAQQVGRAIALGRGDGTINIPLTPDRVVDETTFFRHYEPTDGLHLAKERAVLAEEGFKKVVAANVDLNTIHPKVAEEFLTVLDRQRSPVAPKIVEVPDISTTEITISRTAPPTIAA